MELMIVVAIMGILAAVAIPTFVMLMNRSKTGKATTNINNMFKAAAAYFSAERTGKGASDTVSTNCVVGDGGPDPDVPKRMKQKFDNDSVAFKAIGFVVADFVYYSYELSSIVPAGGCGIPKDSTDVYTFSAHGDLDGDNLVSTFELASGTDSNNTLYHSIGFYIDNELE